MPRFFLPPEELRQDTLLLTGALYNHAKVLRLKRGDAVTVSDGCGCDYACTVAAIEPDALTLTVRHSVPSSSEPRCLCRIYLGFPKADKLEHVIQKATELGAAEIIAFPSSRCVSRPDEKALPKKLARWQKIAVSAAEQSGRARIPQVRALPSYAAALKEAAESELSVLFYENEAQRTFRSVIEAAPFRSAALMTGPEGGFSAEEITAAEQAGLQICTLGSRILRCETAPLCALSALMYATGEF